jgi:transcriptional regulator with XRE-family HTH domain
MSTSTKATAGKGEPTTLRDRRLALGLSQQKVAEQASCSIATVRLLERGWRPAGGSHALERVRGALGL